MKKQLIELKSYWQKEGINTHNGVSESDILKFQMNKNIILPDEFASYLKVVNGMKDFFPNYNDNKGFLFYPLEEMVFFENEIIDSNKEDFHERLKNNSCLVFANFMQRSWWYGLLLNKQHPNSYSVIIIPNEMRYKVISTSFFEFIELYLSNSKKIYNHE